MGFRAECSVRCAATPIDIKAKYEAKYFFVNTTTGEKSGEMYGIRCEK